MIYEKLTGCIGTELSEFLEWNEKKYIPYAGKLGAKLVGLWVSVTGPTRTFLEMWAFEDFAGYGRADEAFRSPKTEEDKQILKELRKYHIASKIEIFRGTPFSPSKGVLEEKELK